MTLQLKPVGTFLWCFGLKIQNTQLVFEKSLGNSSYAQVANFGDTLSENAWRQLLRIWIRPKPISWRPVLHQKEWNLTKVLEQVNVLFFFQKRKKLILEFAITSSAALDWSLKSRSCSNSSQKYHPKAEMLSKSAFPNHGVELFLNIFSINPF